MTRFVFIAAPLVLGLAACGSETADAPGESDDRGARGEVLGGTISDDMIPLDTLESQSPPLRQASETAADGSDPAAAAPDRATEADSESAAEAEAPAAPEEPTAE